MIQVSAPVNPGNSGGPLFDEHGLVIGIVSAKGINVEAVTFAVPVSQLAHFVENRNAPSFSVTTTQADWEEEFRPLAALSRRSKRLSGSPTQKFDSEISQLVLSPDGKMLYMLFAAQGKIQEYDTLEKKIGRTFNSDSAIHSICLSGSTGEYLLIVTETKQAIRISTKTMAKVAECELPVAAVECVFIPGMDNHVLALGFDQSLLVLNRSAFENKKQPIHRLRMPAVPFGIVDISFNSKWFARLNTSSNAYEGQYLVEVLPSSHLQTNLPNMLQYMDSMRSGNNQIAATQLAKILEQRACCTNHFQSCKSFKIGLAVTDPKGVMRMQMVCATGSRLRVKP